MTRPHTTRPSSSGEMARQRQKLHVAQRMLAAGGTAEIQGEWCIVSAPSGAKMVLPVHVAAGLRQDAEG